MTRRARRLAAVVLAGAMVAGPPAGAQEEPPVAEPAPAEPVPDPVPAEPAPAPSPEPAPAPPPPAEPPPAPPAAPAEPAPAPPPPAEPEEPLGAVVVVPRDHDRDRDRHRERQDDEDELLDGGPTNVFGFPSGGLGVPSFLLDRFRIPLFLLPIYQAAGIEYGVRWEVLAAINEVETDYGRNLNVSSAGAVGWMQFMPASWEAYGVDADRDGRKDPYNPVDAIFAAARYLQAAGAATDLRGAIFAYNHSDEYVEAVLIRANMIGLLPASVIGALGGMADGIFPVHAEASYRDPDAERALEEVVIRSRPGAPAVASQSGRIVRIGENERLGRFVVLRDVYGTSYTYAGLGTLAETHPVPVPRTVTPQDVARELDLPVPQQAATSDEPADTTTRARPREEPPIEQLAQSEVLAQALLAPQAGVPSHAAGPGEVAPPAAPDAPAVSLAGANLEAAAAAPGGLETALAALSPLPVPELPASDGLATLDEPDARAPAPETGPTRGDATDATAENIARYTPYLRGLLRLPADEVTWEPLREGSFVVAGTILGRLGEEGEEGGLRFRVRPAGRGAPLIDPRPLLEGWQLLERTRLFRVEGRRPGIGEAMLLDQDALARLVLSDPRIVIYDCGRQDILTGRVDRRVLALLVFLADSGLNPTVTSLQCGHSYLTASGNVSHHSTGTAVDIAALNGVPILGNQGPGSVTDVAVRRLLALQGTMQPDQIITLMTYPGAPNTYAMSDHHDHIHVGFRPLYGENPEGGRLAGAVLEPGQWSDLVARLRDIPQPEVRRR